jgi:WD40 repeat protein
MTSSQEEEELMRDEDDDVDETPEFIRPEDAVEVYVDNDTVPMDEDDDDDDDAESIVPKQQDSFVPDMSKCKIDSHTGPVYAVASSFHGQQQSTNNTTGNVLSVISGGGDDRAFFHSIRIDNGSSPTYTTIPLEHAHADTVSCVALNLDCNLVETSPRLAAAGGYDGAIVIYNADTGAKLFNLEGPTDVEWLAFHPKGGTVLLAGSAADGTVWMFHIPNQSCLQVFVGHERAVTAGSFSSDGKWALSASSDGALRVWAPRTGATRHVFRFNNNNDNNNSAAADAAGLTCMAINGGSDCQLVIVGAEDGNAHVCHVGTKKVVASLRHYEISTTPAASSNQQTSLMNVAQEMELPMSVEAVGFASQSVNPHWCATGGVDGTLKIWDLANNGQRRQCCTMPDASAGITRLQWHATLPVVFTCCTNGAVYLWDARNGSLLQTITGSNQVNNDMAISFANDESKTAWIVTASDDHSVRVFECNVMAALQPASANVPATL